MADLELSGLTKVFGDNRAVTDLNLTVKDGELLVIVGPSGSGKSTALRMIAGLEVPTEGTIRINDREVHKLIPSQRSIAMVFQSYALYTHMTVRENISYGLKHSTNHSKTERKERVHETAELLQIEDLLDKHPAELSGGQKQRVALGRAIAREPAVFLLDEPLSNLDAKLRAHMRTELQRLHERIGVTTLYVTHDQKEAMTMADRIAIMRNGRLQQITTPEEAYDHPANEFVGTFLGSPSMNLLDATVYEDGNDYVFNAFNRGVTLARIPKTAIPKIPKQVRVGIRPEDLTLARTSEVAETRIATTDGGRFGFDATIILSQYQGKEQFVELDVGGAELMMRAPPTVSVRSGEDATVVVDPTDIFLFDPETGASLKTRGIETPGDAG